MTVIFFNGLKVYRFKYHISSWR